MVAAGTVELQRRRRRYAEQEEGRKEGLYTCSWLCLVCVAGKAAREGRIKSAAKERELGGGRRAVIPVCLLRLRRPSPESSQDGEANGGDDRGADEGLRHGQRQKAQLLVSA